MAKKKVAIVCSYKVDCGLAYCAERIEDNLKRYYDVEVIPVDLELLRAMSPQHVIKAGNAHIAQIAARLQDFDYVNIQMEAGLYGRSYELIAPRVHTLLKGLKSHAVLTLHFPPVQWLDRTDIIKMVLRYSFLAPFAIYAKYSNVIAAMRMWRWFRKGTQTDKFSMVVLNAFEKTCLEHYYDMPNVYDAPLSFLNAKDREYVRARISKKDFKTRYGLDDQDVMVAAFGFFMPYKGFSDVINALRHLPPQYKLVLCGGTNITVIKEFSDCDSYLRAMLGHIRALGLEERVIFTGTLSEDDLNTAMAHCDIAVLPYLETYQVASGPATLAIELAEKIIASNATVFDRYEKYYPGRIAARYHTGNHLALAQQIERVNAMPSCGTVPYLQPDIITHTDLYREIWEKKNP